MNICQVVINKIIKMITLWLNDDTPPMLLKYIVLNGTILKDTTIN